MSSLQKKMRTVNYRWSVYFLSLPIILFHVLSLTGCTSKSPGIPNLYLIKIHDIHSRDVVSSGYEVRVGYYGICHGQPSNLECHTTIANQTSATETPATTGTSSLDTFAKATQKRIFLALPTASGLLFMIALAAIIVYQHGVKSKSAKSKQNPPPRAGVARVAIITTWLSVMLILASTVGVAQAAGSMHMATTQLRSSLTVEIGYAIQVLNWVMVAFSLVFGVGTTVLLQSSTSSKKSLDDAVFGLSSSGGGMGEI